MLEPVIPVLAKAVARDIQHLIRTSEMQDLMVQMYVHKPYKNAPCASNRNAFSKSQR